MLEGCLKSVREANSDVACRVTLVDNASGDGVAGQAESSFPAIDVVEMEDNVGFSAAVNRGLAGVSEPFVLLLNTDTVLAPGALAAMAAALEKGGGDCAGVAPKMMSSSHEGIIDAVGTVMPPDGASFTRGIGQCDLGQYDRDEEVLGVCFGASLLQRQLFEPAAVGPLYEDYFLYFEDSDWCMRARSQGYRFLTVPEAVVNHMHSGVTRHESLDFKYRLIELNTLKITVRTFENPLRAAAIVAARSLRLAARTLIRRKFIAANISTLASFAAELPRLLKERQELKRRRIVSDNKVFAMAAGEDAFFDTVAYRPDRCLDSIIATYSRLLEDDRNPETGKILAALYRLRQRAAAEEDVAGAESEEVLQGLPVCVKSLLKAAGSVTV